METVLKLAVLLNIIALVLSDGGPVEEPNPIPVGRQGRKNYGVYRPPRDYGDDGDDKDDANDDSDPPPPRPPSSGNDYPNFNTYKGYDPVSSYDPPARFPNNYKGYPFYSPYWKGGPKAAGGDPSTAQMMEMMMALNNDAKPDDDGGIISKLVSDPKSFATAAIIPLSIVLAATVPVFMNYMMTAPTPLVSTTATGSKEGRSLDNRIELSNILSNIARFARTLDGDDCIQKTLCKVATRGGDPSSSEYIKRAANVVASVVKEEWVDNLGMKHLVEGLKHGNCADVCSGDDVRPRE